MDHIAVVVRQRGVVPARPLDEEGEVVPAPPLLRSCPSPSSHEEGSAAGRGWCGCKSTPTTPSASPTPLLEKGGEEHLDFAVVPLLEKGGEEHPTSQSFSPPLIRRGELFFPSSHEEGSAAGRGWCGCRSKTNHPVGFADTPP